MALFYPKGRNAGCFPQSSANSIALKQYEDPCERRDLKCIRDTLMNDARVKT